MGRVRIKEERIKEKGGGSMSKKILGIAVVLFLAGTIYEVYGASSTSTVSVLVTPSVSVQLTPSTTSYDFGTVAVNTSSGAVTPITLTNSGNVSVVLTKTITSDPSPWVADTTTGDDQYVLWVATSTTQPNYSGLNTNCQFGAVNNTTLLTDANGNGGGPVPANGSVKLWFRIDMPVTTSDSNPKTIEVSIAATGQ